MADRLITDDAIASLVEESKEKNKDNDYSNLQGLIKQRFIRSEDSRLFDESRWLKAYRNYRGLYGSDMTFTEKEKSRVFVKITKTKVLAAFGQLIEVLFSSGKFPIGVEPTIIPDGIAKFASVGDEEAPKKKDPKVEIKDLYGYD